jgi:hypothetical protein
VPVIFLISAIAHLRLSAVEPSDGVIANSKISKKLLLRLGLIHHARTVKGRLVVGTTTAV